MFRNVREELRCPVGDEKIGDRWTHNSAAAYCNDCDVTYFFREDETKPYKSIKGNTLVTVKTKGCGCGRCGR